MDEGIDSGSGSGAFGSPGATGGRFNPVEFVKKPQVILRILSWVFAVIVFGCIASSAWNGNICYFGAGTFGDWAACGYGTAIGVIAFLLAMAFLAADAVFDNLSNAMHRKNILVADIVSSGIMAFLWFVCFCYLANGWRLSKHDEYWNGTSALQAAIAFSFFSIPSFVALAVLAMLRYRQGVPSTLPPQYKEDPFGGFETQPSN